MKDRITSPQENQSKMGWTSFYLAYPPNYLATSAGGQTDLAEATDAMGGYAKDKVLSQVQQQQVQVILVAPVGKGQPWNSVLLEMLYGYLWQLPHTSFQPMS